MAGDGHPLLPGSARQLLGEYLSAKVILYSKKHCQQCVATEVTLKKHKVMFNKVMIDEKPDALEYVKSLGYLEAPVVVVDQDGNLTHWSGFRSSRIEELAELSRKAQG